MSNTFDLDRASSAEGPIGAGKSWNVGVEILTYAHAKGLVSGISLAGVQISPDHNATVAIYDKQPSAEGISRGAIKSTPGADAFLKAVDEIGRKNTAVCEKQMGQL